MNIDEYFSNIKNLAEIVNAGDLQVHDLLESPGEHAAMVNSSIRFRQELLSEKEVNDLSGYLVIGIFPGLDRRERLAAFAMTFDVEHEAARLRVRRLCEPYSEDQELFLQEPSLIKKIRRRVSGTPDDELIDLAALRSVSGSEIYQTKNGFAKLSSYLSPGIVNWAHGEWPSAPIYIRLDADRFYKQRPLQLLTEATLVPANPRWLSDFSLQKGMKDFARYQLMNVSPKANPAEFWEYSVRHLRQLEVRVERREQDYLTMIIEELPRADDPSGLMISRCIHLDTRDPARTPLQHVKVQHLDLAINVYADEDRKERFQQTFEEGKAKDATFRTHLFRIEDVPFGSLFTFAELFLESRILFSEWLNEVASD